MSKLRGPLHERWRRSARPPPQVRNCVAAWSPGSDHVECVTPMVRKNSVLLALGGIVAAGATSVIVASLMVTDGMFRSFVPEKPPVAREESLIDVAKANARIAEILASNAPFGPKLQNLLRRLGAERVDPVSKQQLVCLLLEFDPAERRLVAQALGLLEGDEETARELLRLCGGDNVDPELARIIFEALARMRVAALLPDLLVMLDAGSPYETLIVDLVCTTGGRAGGEALVARLTGSIRSETRQTIIAALIKYPDPEVLLTVGNAIPRADPQNRKSLVEILGRVRDVRFVDELCALYAKEPDEEVRLKILRALGRIGNRDSALFLLEHANRDRPDASFAASAIGEIRRPDALEALAERWDTLKPAVRSAVMESAARLANPTAKLVATATVAIRDSDERTRIGAARILGRPGTEAHIEPLVDFLARNRTERALAVGLDSLLRIGTPAAAEAVMAALHVAPEKARDVYRLRARRILTRKPD